MLCNVKLIGKCNDRMMSDFMFPIYLATNKIQNKREKTGESEKEQKAQLKTEKIGNKRGLW